ncbi:MAG: hypothetical protein GF400_10285, partial [Candidatus Eisenbacteria bacterium]|nr:hypothetical protein [Candidatus Eisenbacteria bacterium]
MSGRLGPTNRTRYSFLISIWSSRTERSSKTKRPVPSPSGRRLAMTRLLAVSAALLACTLMLAAVSVSYADTITVDCQGTGDYETIQEGINAAAEGDTVMVLPGGYFGPNNRNLHFDGKGVTLMSSAGRRATTINADNADRIFNLGPSTGFDTVIEGFTIMNGTHDYGGGFFCNGASPTIRDCIITACTATYMSNGGGGIQCYDEASPVITDVTISACQASNGAGLLALLNSAPTLTRVSFMSNTSYDRAGGAYFENPGSRFAITDCVFYNNNCTDHDGGGLYLLNASPQITGCTFVMNRGANAGHIMLTQDSDPTIENCILAFTRSGPPVFGWNEDQDPTITRCIVYGNDGGDGCHGTVSDTLNCDPRFCGMLSTDFTLCSNSWALPGNNSWGVQIGAYGDGGCGECETPV